MHARTTPPPPRQNAGRGVGCFTMALLGLIIILLIGALVVFAAMHAPEKFDSVMTTITKSLHGLWSSPEPAPAKLQVEKPADAADKAAPTTNPTTAPSATSGLIPNPVDDTSGLRMVKGQPYPHREEMSNANADHKLLEVKIRHLYPKPVETGWYKTKGDFFYWWGPYEPTKPGTVVSHLPAEKLADKWLPADHYYEIDYLDTGFPEPFLPGTIMVMFRFVEPEKAPSAVKPAVGAAAPTAGGKVVVPDFKKFQMEVLKKVRELVKVPVTASGERVFRPDKEYHLYCMLGDMPYYLPIPPYPRGEVKEEGDWTIVKHDGQEFRVKSENCLIAPLPLRELNQPQQSAAPATNPVRTESGWKVYRRSDARQR
jgi:hypothetical protein